MSLMQYALARGRARRSDDPAITDQGDVHEKAVAAIKAGASVDAVNAKLKQLGATALPSSTVKYAAAVARAKGKGAR